LLPLSLPPNTISAILPETILQIPLSSNPTALALRKPSEQPYLQQPNSGMMKSGTKLSSTAFLPPVPFLLFSQKSKTSTLAPTSLALLDGSPQKPSTPRNQHPPWFSLSRAKKQQIKPSHLASPFSAESSKFRNSSPLDL